MLRTIVNSAQLYPGYRCYSFHDLFVPFKFSENFLVESTSSSVPFSHAHLANFSYDPLLEIILNGEFKNLLLFMFVILFAKRTIFNYHNSSLSDLVKQMTRERRGVEQDHMMRRERGWGRSWSGKYRNRK